MTTVSLSDRLRRARRRSFVGRAEELALFRTALAAKEPPFAVLYLAGPAGIGKSMLLVEFAGLCAQSGIPACYLDGRDLEPTPAAFVGALGQALAGDGRLVLLIDSYEAIAGLDRWLRDLFLPQLSADVLVVLASRNPPALAWRIDPGWRSLLHPIALRNLSPEESRAYLAACGVAPQQQRSILDFTHGYPLALALVAELLARDALPVFQPQAAPDLVKTLLDQFVERVPSPDHRAALDVCALLHLTNEALLGEVLELADAPAIFAWLRELPFIEAGRQGLYPQDLVREALMAELQWRDRDWALELRRRVRAIYTRQLRDATIQAQQRILTDYIFLHRHNPAVGPFFATDHSVSLVASLAGPADWPALRAMVAQHEGEEAARLAAYWFERQPTGVLVFRDSGVPSGAPVGFVQRVALHEAAAADREADPATRAAWHYLIQHAPLRRGEGATLFRCWMARDSYQDLSPVQKQITVATVQHYLTAPGLAFSLIAYADPDLWCGLYAYVGFPRLPQADFTIGGRRYGVYCHDWRATPPLVWLELLAEREIDEQAVRPVTLAPAPLVVLSQDAFAEAVRVALRLLGSPERLRESPLLRARLVVERGGARPGDAQSVATLQALLREACETLRDDSHDRKSYRALQAAYLPPAMTQEQAAEALGLPFSTFRRHLKAGLDRVTQLLWDWEVHGRELTIEAGR